MTVTAPPPVPHYPHAAPIEGYGRGGFRFAGMSHRGSLLLLPNGIWGWPVATACEISEETLSRVFEQAEHIRLFLLGTGERSEALDPALRRRFREANVALEVTRTAYAANTYNILLEEGRSVAAGLVAVD